MFFRGSSFSSLRVIRAREALQDGLLPVVEFAFETLDAFGVLTGEAGLLGGVGFEVEECRLG
jgi:hypothetical protein